MGKGGQSYKANAIKQIASILIKLFRLSPHLIFVPIPPSKFINDPEYDNRLIKVLELVKKETTIPFVEAIRRTENNTPLHEKPVVRTLDNHKFKFYGDDISIFKNKTIVIFDDVITTGSSYKAAKNIIKQNVPDSKIVGFFLARAISEYEKAIIGFPD